MYTRAILHMLQMSNHQHTSTHKVSWFQNKLITQYKIWKLQKRICKPMDDVMTTPYHQAANDNQGDATSKDVINEAIFLIYLPSLKSSPPANMHSK